MHQVAAAVSAHISASHCRHRWLSKLSRCNTKGKWIAEEDAMLRRIVDRSGTRDWATIAEQMPGRSVKQCREHWQNYLAAGLTHSEWTAAEDRTLLDLAVRCPPAAPLSAYHLLTSAWHRGRVQGRYGRSWQRIAAHMPGRPSNCVKNRWYLVRPARPTATLRPTLTPLYVATVLAFAADAARGGVCQGERGALCTWPATRITAPRGSQPPGQAATSG